MSGFTFNGNHSSGYFIVNRVGRTMLPNISPKLLTIPNRPGAYDFGSEIGMREFSVDVTIIQTSPGLLVSMLRIISDWLCTDKAAPLMFDDEPGKTYYAKISGDTQIDTLVSMGTGTIKFICPDPYAYGARKTLLLPGPSSAVTNAGLADTYPVITAKFTKSTPYFAIGNGKQNVILGTAPTIGKPTVPQQEVVLHADGTTLDGWQTGNSTDDFDGDNRIAGKFIVFGGYALKAVEYGSKDSPAWHGPAIRRALPEPLQDFTVTAIVEQDSTENHQIGRVGFNLIDQNGANFGLMFMNDNSQSVMNGICHCRIGPNGGGVGLYYDEPGCHAYTNKSMYLSLSRIGQTWTMYVTQKDLKTGKTYWGLTKTWVDVEGKFSKFKLAALQLAAYQYQLYEPVYGQFIHYATVYKENKVDPEKKTPIIAEKDDVIEIDCEKGSVTKNGLPAFWLLDPASDFFPLKHGQNNLAYTTTDPTAQVTLTHRERWL